MLYFGLPIFIDRNYAGQIFITKMGYFQSSNKILKDRIIFSLIFLDGNVRTGQSPAQASVAPSPLRQEPQVPQPSMGAPYALQQQAQNSNTDKQDPNKSSVLNNRYPVVKLGRLSVSIPCHF